MKIEGLTDVLNLFTDIPFTEWAWSEAPEEGYGVVTADGQKELKADADPVAEKMLTGYVDVFVKTSAPDPTDDVENAMKALGIWFREESVQFETETGFLHFEWRWTDVVHKAKKALNLEELPIVLHITGTEAVEGQSGQTYRKVTFASGETEKLFENRNDRDMIINMPIWADVPGSVTEVLRKIEVIENGTITQVRFETGLQPLRPADATQDRTIGSIESYEINVFYNDGVYHSAVATHFTSDC